MRQIRHPSGCFRAKGALTARTPSLIARTLLAFGMVGVALPAADWPQWHGPTRNGYASPEGLMVSSLPVELKPAWKKPIGGGFSSPIVAGGKLVYLDERAGQEVAHLLDAESGRELWSVAYASAFQDEWGAGPRSTPILDGDRLYVVSCTGEFRCLSLADGRIIWGTSFEKDFGVKFLGSKVNEGTATRRGNNGCGVIEGARIVLPVGGTPGASLVCFDKLTGRVLWKGGDDEAAYSSPVIGALAGVRQVVAFTADALVGVDLASGQLLWRVPLKTDAKRHAGSPVLVGDTVIVNSQTIGLVCTRIVKENGVIKAVRAWVNPSLKINLATPVLLDHYLYSQGVSPDYVCVDARTGELKWAQTGFGGGKQAFASTIVAGKNLLVLTYDGQLLLLAADPARYHELGRQQVCGKTWSSPAYADGYLFLRDGRELLRLDLTGKVVP